MLITKPEGSLSKSELLMDPCIRDSFSLGNSIQLLKRRNPQTKIGFANGKFRVLTPAHCVFLSLCKTKCDILIAAVNGDYSLRLLGKKSSFSSQERAFALATLSVVDYVTIFDEETPALCISNINPDVIFKGPDYKKEEVVSAGKEVEIIQHPFDLHVSDIEGSKSNSFFDVSQVQSRFK